MKVAEIREKLYTRINKGQYKLDNALNRLDPNSEYSLVVCTELEEYKQQINAILSREEYIHADANVYAGTVSILDFNSMSGDLVLIRLVCVSADSNAEIICVYIGGLI